MRDSSLLSDEVKKSKLTTMLEFHNSERIVEVADDNSFDLSANFPEQEEEPKEESTLMDQLLADAQEVEIEKKIALKGEAKRMKKQFGSGLKKGFFTTVDSSSSSTKLKKKISQKKKATTNVETISTSRIQKKSGDSVQSKMTAEVQESMAASDSSWNLLLSDPSWLTPDLLDRICANPRLRAGLMNSKYQEALTLLRTDPEKAKKTFEHDKELNAFMYDICEIMGGHFNEIGTKDEQMKRYAAIEKELGPLAAQIAEKHDKENESQVNDATCLSTRTLPSPQKNTEFSNRKEYKPNGPSSPNSTNDNKKRGQQSDNDGVTQEQVNAILNDDNLRTLLSDPGTQRLMQRCADPREFAKAMTDPDSRAKIHTLARAGLVQLSS
mmetsp:Transcript_18141/g.27379  ORF Transcript_18141/g.27379 Transcript_18141/m.27379 type:complete len:382 (-) Transcript_18141:77-1222(-)